MERAEGWPTWAVVIVALQVATLVVALTPWLFMTGMMGMAPWMTDMMREYRP